jgi:hypothetical protein
VILRRGGLTTKSLATLTRGYGLLCFSALPEQAQDASKHKSPAAQLQGFLL